MSVNQKIITLLLVATVFSTSCGTNITYEAPIPNPGFVTATLAGDSAPTAAATPASPASLLPTAHPIEGTTTTQINVRSEPATIGISLGTIAPFSKVQILGREANGAWYQIIYVNSADGKGWVTALYVQVDAAAQIPVVQAGAGPGLSGLVIQPINIRSGPGRDYDSLGNLTPNDVVTVIGKDTSGAWMQITLRTDVGWVASEFLKVAGIDNLPVTADTTQVITTGESTEGTTPVPAPNTYFQDKDSMHSPSVSVQLSSSGMGAVQFSGKLSMLDADTEDWLQFTSTGSEILVRVKCSEIGLRVELWNDIGPVEEILLSCEETEIVELESGRTYWLRVVASESALQVRRYLLMLELVR